MFEYSRISILMSKIIYFVFMAHFGNACFHAVARERNGVINGGNNTACNQTCARPNQLIRVIYFVAFDCTKDSKLNFAGQEIERLGQISCNTFVTGISNTTYTMVLGEKCHEVPVVEHFQLTNYDGNNMYFGRGSLDGTICESGTYYFMHILSENRIGNCRSKGGLRHIESKTAYMIVKGGKCDSECYGKAVENLCPGAR